MMEVLKYVSKLAWPWFQKKLEREYNIFQYSVGIVFLGFLASMLVLAGASRLGGLPRRINIVNPYRRYRATAAGLLLFGPAWELAGRTNALGPSWPPLSRVIAALTTPDNVGLFQRGLSATLGEAVPGYVIGIGGAMLSGVVCVLVPRL